MASNASGSLEGVCVIDLTRMLAGPFSTMVLADLGADVIKIEPPFGDLSRTMGPFCEDDEKQYYGGYFQSVNRNKRSVVLDLKTSSGRDLLRALVRDADILVENFRPGVMESWNLGYEDLAEVNPGLIYGAIRGFGDPRTGKSPMSQWPAYDVVAQAMGGLIGITGQDGQPTKVGPGIGDIFPGVLCAVGVLAALNERSSSGRGQFVDVGMYDAVLSLCERIVYQYSYSGDVAHPEGNTHPLLSPFDIFECLDGHIAIAAPSKRHWIALTTIMKRPDLGTSFVDHQRRLSEREYIRREIAAWVATRTKAVIIELLGGAVPIGPVNTVRDIFADPHVSAREMLIELEQPGSAQLVTVVGNPIKMTRTHRNSVRRAPLLGEHTAEVLAERAIACEAEGEDDLL